MPVKTNFCSKLGLFEFCIIVLCGLMEIFKKIKNVGLVGNEKFYVVESFTEELITFSVIFLTLLYTTKNFRINEKAIHTCIYAHVDSACMQNKCPIRNYQGQYAYF